MSRRTWAWWMWDMESEDFGRRCVPVLTGVLTGCCAVMDEDSALKGVDWFGSSLVRLAGVKTLASLLSSPVDWTGMPSTSSPSKEVGYKLRWDRIHLSLTSTMSLSTLLLQIVLPYFLQFLVFSKHPLLSKLEPRGKFPLRFQHATAEQQWLEWLAMNAMRHREGGRERERERERETKIECTHIGWTLHMVYQLCPTHYPQPAGYILDEWEHLFKSVHGQYLS